MDYQPRMFGEGVADPIEDVRGQGMRSVGDVNLGAYYNFIQNPRSAAQNLLRSKGYNPTINPYQRQLASRLAQQAQLRNMINIVNGGEEMDARDLAASAEDDMAGGLYGKGELRNGNDVNEFMGKLNSMVRLASDPTTSTNLTPTQRALSKMFEPGANGQYDDNNLTDFFTGLYDRFSSPALRRLRERMYQDSIDQFRGSIAPSEPNRGLLDFLTGSMRIGG